MSGSDKLWGGRFTGQPDETFAEFNSSFRFDRRLFVADVSASIEWAIALEKAGVISIKERNSIVAGLKKMLEDEASDPHYFDGSDAEDVHSFIEGKLVGSIGDAGRKLHTGRSRNDQVATSLRLWVRHEIEHLDRLVTDVQSSLIGLAERHADAVMAGYTHLQRAQPILFAHWCLAYFEMFKRDRDRLADTLRRVNVLPLGSGALAGTSFAIDREAIAKELGFDDVSANSLDSVSDRDFAVEFVSACSLVMVHLSRLAEDMIIYCSAEFGFVNLSDAVSSGSSLMPQKKNADALELIRGKAGRVFGHNISLLTMLKALPLAYNKDMQEDKEALFDAADTVSMCLRVARIVLDKATVNEAKTREAAIHSYSNATELADYLVRKAVPFRTAHETVGQIILFAIEQGLELNELTIETFRRFSPVFGNDVFDALSLDAALATKKTIGGTSPERVTEALAAAKKYLKDDGQD